MNPKQKFGAKRFGNFTKFPLAPAFNRIRLITDFWPGFKLEFFYRKLPSVEKIILCDAGKSLNEALPFDPRGDYLVACNAGEFMKY